MKADDPLLALIQRRIYDEAYSESLCRSFLNFSSHRCGTEGLSVTGPVLDVTDEVITVEKAKINGRSAQQRH
jgi:hypothetical protein